jgi:hypothetical protein
MANLDHLFDLTSARDEVHLPISTGATTLRIHMR